MSDEIESGTPAKEETPKPKKPRARKAAASAEADQASAASRPGAARERKPASRSRKTESAAGPAPKKRAARKSATKQPAEETVGELQPAVEYDFSGAEHLRAPAEDPIGDVSDGEARAYTGIGLESAAQSEAEAYREETAMDAVDGTLESREAVPLNAGDSNMAAAPEQIPRVVAAGRENEAGRELGPPARLERLQKILSQAGIASRRHAEEMITEGRVMVNGQVVTALGSKADPQRDHIRVDGKLLHGAERHRYFVLNKPKGYVTTVSDPEGRPTVMELVRKLGERVYPVGRLDFQSEGLLLMTNDGALANQLTHASSGVEKIYLVKIAGQPDEEELERLRNGIMIERGGPSSSGLYGPGGRVRTAPARIRQIRPGANPWYEVVLTEGRNRELRKMFSAVGHYVEKIRRVGYGPLVLDVEPGQIRELTLAEVDALRQTAEGKLKPRRIRTEAMLPREAGRTAEERPAKPRAGHGRRRDEQTDFRRRPAQRFRNQERSYGVERARSEERPRVQDRSRTQGRPERELRGQRRDWQAKPREERPARNRPEERPPAFGRRREEHGQRPERRGKAFGSRPPRGEESRGGAGRGFDRGPGARGPGRGWNQGAGARPARGESGAAPFRGRAEGSHGGRAQGGTSSGAAAGRPGRGFGAQGGKAGGARRGEAGGRRREFGARRDKAGRTGGPKRGQAGGARRGPAGGGRSGGFRPPDKRRGGGRGK